MIRWTGLAPWEFELIAWAGALCAWLAMAASSFLAPNLTTLTSELSMTEGIAGTTLLALGNGTTLLTLVNGEYYPPRSWKR